MTKISYDPRAVARLAAVRPPCDNAPHRRAIYCADRMLVVSILIGCLVALILF
jgi:hypothetical protein